jgi:hypothetical protein
MIEKLEALKNEMKKEGRNDYAEYIQEIIKCAGKKRKAIYVAAFLTPLGREDLENWWGTVVQKDFLDKQFMHHVTIKYKPSEEEVTSLPIGDKVSLKIIGYSEDERGQAVLVSGIEASNTYPHITISTSLDTSPVYSNDLIAAGFTEKDGIEIEARIGFAIPKGAGEVEAKYDFEGTIYEE